MTSADIAALRAFVERELTDDEIAQYLDAPVTEDERRGVLELVEWFCRRYPTPLARLHYVTRAHARWGATRPQGPTP
ncbi:MAG TPA: hypothetical protein VMO26_26535 [Vicinamibacterales bacterium]|nr:hypothetical protein [Vicinamibacterales bacterium]